MTNPERLAPGDIVIGNRLRGLDREAVDGLKKSIIRIGIKMPISVRHVDDRWELVAGYHRLQAAIELGLDTVPVRVETGDETDARLWEIGENLYRADLTVLERDQQIAEWKRLVEKRDGRNSPIGDDGSSATEPTNDTAEDQKPAQVAPVSKGGRGHQGGVRAAARELGVDRDQVRRAETRVNKIAPDVQDRIKATRKIANTGVELDALASLSEEQQRQATSMVERGEAQSVREAKSVLTGSPDANAASSGSPTTTGPATSVRDSHPEDRTVAFRVKAGDHRANLAQGIALALGAARRLRENEEPTDSGRRHPDDVPLQPEDLSYLVDYLTDYERGFLASRKEAHAKVSAPTEPT